MTMVRLEHALDSGIKGVSPTQYVPVRNLSVADLERLQAADLDDILSTCTGLSVDQVRRLTSNDRTAIIAARRSIT